jgi:Tol biopolymer transport system component
VAIVPAENGGEAVDASWSPDGHKILYHTFDGGPKLHTYDLDRHESTNIPGSDGLWSPRWSPDGRYIAAMTVPNITIKLFDLQTQQWSTLVEHMGGWGFPTWSHDGKSLYALNGPGPWSVYRIPVPRGVPDRVVDLTDVHLTGAIGFWFGLDPNDNPLLLRSKGISDIYALTLDRR